MHARASENAENRRFARLVSSPALARLLIHFVLHPDRRLHFRALRRHAGIGMASLQIETERLRALGLILREKRGGRVFYRPELEHSAWQPIRELIRTTADPVEVLEDALAQVPGIQAAFVFGSFARGEAVEESDVDVLVLGEEIPSAQIGWAGLESSILLGRSVNICRLTREEIEARLALGSVFVKSILESPKRWIIGNEEVLPQAA